MKYPAIIVVVIGAGILALLNFLYPPSPQAITITPAPSKNITASNLTLREIWRRSEMINLGNNEPPELIISNGLIVFSVAEDRNPDAFQWVHSVDQKIVALNIQTGEPIWTFGPIFDQPYSITTDGQRVYAGYLRYVRALDLQTGKELWIGAKQRDDKHGGLYVYTTKNRIEVYDDDVSIFPPNQYLFVLNARTGETVDTIQLPELFFRLDDIYYTSIWLGGSFGAGIIAHDPITNRELWTLHTRDNVRRWPLVVNGIMYLDGGDVYAFDAKTGKVYWEYKDLPIFVPGTDKRDKRYHNYFVSRITYADGMIYFLRSDGNFIRLNAKTGQEMGYIDVKPAPVYYNDEGIFQDTLNTIVASDKYVAVYYSDSQELIVFERTDVTP